MIESGRESDYKQDEERRVAAVRNLNKQKAVNEYKYIRINGSYWLFEISAQSEHNGVVFTV